MKTVDQTLEQLDNLLDDVEELIQQLPFKPERKRQIVSMIYDLWMEIEHDADLPPADFS